MAASLKNKLLGSVGIPPITDDAAFARAGDLLTALKAQLVEAERAVKIAELEPWAGRGSKADQANVAHQLRRLRAEQATVAPNPKAPALDRAIDLIFGKRAPAATPADDTAQARQDIDTLGEAIGAQSEIVENLRGELSLAMAKQLSSEHRARVLALYRAAQALVRARDAETDLHSDLIAAGYIYRADILPNFNLGGAYAIGSESTWDSQISTLRRTLEERGVL